jgi:hypothetical protein
MENSKMFLIVEKLDLLNNGKVFAVFSFNWIFTFSVFVSWSRGRKKVFDEIHHAYGK